MPKKQWGFLTNHALVLIHVFEHPSSTLREISQAVGITERAALSILRQLEDEDCVRRQKVGRRVHYTVDLDSARKMRTRLPYNMEEIVAGIARLFAESRKTDPDDDGDSGDETETEAEAGEDDDGAASGGGVKRPKSPTPGSPGVSAP